MSTSDEPAAGSRGGLVGVQRQGVAAQPIEGQPVERRPVEGQTGGGDEPIRVRLDLAYDGTDFSGWAVQPGRRTVAGTLGEALGRVLRIAAGDLGLTVAGRTDAGVHARGQVAHIDVPADRAELVGQLPRRMVRVLPADIRLREAIIVPAAFDARFAALRRRYRYRIADQPPSMDPLRRAETAWWLRPLNAEAMRDAAALLLGEHDFAAFCRRRDGATTVRGLQRLDVVRDGDQVLIVDVAADAFCHSMVRSLVGALGAVGEGRRLVDWPASLLELDRRADSVPVAPAHGLTLMGVDYPPTAQLAARAQLTRAVRSAPQGGCSASSQSRADSG